MNRGWMILIVGILGILALWHLADAWYCIGSQPNRVCVGNPIVPLVESVKDTPQTLVPTATPVCTGPTLRTMDGSGNILNTYHTGCN